MLMTYFDSDEKQKCDFCGKEHKDVYALGPDNYEFDILTKDFEQFADIPVILVCEYCLQGHCGAVRGKTPTKWFKEVYPELIKQRNERKAKE